MAFRRAFPLLFVVLFPQTLVNLRAAKPDQEQPLVSFGEGFDTKSIKLQDAEAGSW